MDPDKFKSVAIKTEVYKKIWEMSDEYFGLPVSMSKTVEYFIHKAYDEWKKKNSKNGFFDIFHNGN